MPTIKYYLDLGVLGEDLDCVVEYDYQPRERETAYYPGCDESFNVTDVVIQGILLSPHHLAILIDHLNADENLRDRILDKEVGCEDDRAEAMEER